MMDSLRKLFGKKPKSAKKAQKPARRSFRPMVDSLEDRCMMAVLFVDDNLQQFPAAQYTSIQAAVNAAQPGDIIQVFAGKYNEAVNIPAAKPRLTLVGASTGPTFATNPQLASIIDPAAASNGTGVFIQANDTVIRGFTIGDLDNNNPAQSYGMQISPLVSGYTVSSNVFQDSTYGIDLGASGARVSTVSGNWFRNNNDAGGASGNGIYSDKGARNVHIVGNTVTDQNNAAFLFTGTTVDDNNVGLRIEGNVIGAPNRLNSGAQILLTHTTNSIVSGNSIFNSNYRGIGLGGSVDNTTVRGNAIVRPAAGGIDSYGLYGVANFALRIESNSVTNAGDTGIRLRDGTTSTVVFANTVTGSTASYPFFSPVGNGIAVIGSNNNVIQSNTVTQNQANGIFVGGGSAGNVIRSNVALLNGNSITTFDLSEEATSLFLNFWAGNTALTRSRPGL